MPFALHRSSDIPCTNSGINAIVPAQFTTPNMGLVLNAETVVQRWRHCTLRIDLLRIFDVTPTRQRHRHFR